MNILIIEPHFDDAWINMGGYILSHSQDNFFILTLSDYKTNKINGLIELQKNILNINGEFLGYKSLGFEDDHMKYLERKFNEKNYLKLFLKINKLNSLKEIKNKIKKYSNNKDKIFWPMGLKHPQHIIMEKINPFRKFYYYREFPYFFYKDQKEDSIKLMYNYKKIIIDISKFLSKKIRIFRKVYPEQKFLLDLSIDNIKLENLKEEVFFKTY